MITQKNQPYVSLGRRVLFAIFMVAWLCSSLLVGLGAIISEAMGNTFRIGAPSGIALVVLAFLTIFTFIWQDNR